MDGNGSWEAGNLYHLIMNLPEKMILLDMVAGHVQTIQPPVNSDRKIYQEIQSIANGLGYGANFLDPSSTRYHG